MGHILGNLEITIHPNDRNDKYSVHFHRLGRDKPIRVKNDVSEDRVNRIFDTVKDMNLLRHDMHVQVDVIPNSDKPGHWYSINKRIETA